MRFVLCDAGRMYYIYYDFVGIEWASDKNQAKCHELRSNVCNASQLCTSASYLE